MWLGGDSGQVAVGRMSNRVRDISHTRAQSSPNMLYPAYPNPLNAQTTIPYVIAKQGHVQLTVYSLRGRHVATLVNRVQAPGEYTVMFRVEDLPSGLYFVRLQTAGQQRVQKIVLVR